MAHIKQVLARVFVSSLEEALPLYEALADRPAEQRFSFNGVELVRVGPFLLLAGDEDTLAPYRDRVASIIVDDVGEVAREVTDFEGELLAGPMDGPNGLRLIARHPDGAVFEYLEIPGD